MERIDWKRKLASRKFWIAIIGFITPLFLLFKIDEEMASTITSLIMSGSALIAYILAEGYIDGKREEGNNVIMVDDCDDDTIK